MKIRRTIIIAFIILSMIIVGTYTIYERVNNPIKGTWYCAIEADSDYSLVFDTFKVKYYRGNEEQSSSLYTYKDNTITYDNYTYNVDIIDDDCIHIYDADTLGLGNYAYYLVRSNERITDMKELVGDWNITYMYNGQCSYPFTFRYNEETSVLSYLINNNSIVECTFVNDFLVADTFDFLVYKINDHKVMMIDAEAVEVWILER